MTDVLLETAVSNWGPRFTANGVDASDYARITGPLEYWDDWCAAWCAGAEEQLAMGEEALREERRRSAGEYFARAATYFHFGKFMFVHDLDQARAAHARAAMITGPFMVIMGKRDRVYPWQDGERLVNEAQGETKFVLLDEGN